MKYEEKLDKIEQGIDNLSELLGITQLELIEAISVGIKSEFEDSPDEVFDLLDYLEDVFK